jgi:hypothetical protein
MFILKPFYFSLIVLEEQILFPIHEDETELCKQNLTIGISKKKYIILTFGSSMPQSVYRLGYALRNRGLISGRTASK